ncbi:MAG: histidinol-phosphatase HisJ [Pseudomonadota bacterium]
MRSKRTSYHGGHSGQYCSHARDRLEDIILRYIELGFKTVGITEHIPPSDDRFRYPDEKALNLTAKDLFNRFDAYIRELNVLKTRYADRITIYIGMETETVTGYKAHVNSLIKQFKPDYIVGSVHHVDDICFDYSQKAYDALVASLGSFEALYKRYFDLQYEMIKTLKPFVVGHFDMIRIYDDNYHKRILSPEIEQKIDRNLELIKSLNLVMDLNLRPLTKGNKEPYITESILAKVKKAGIRVVPGDDSHGVDQAGLNIDKAIDILTQHGFDTHWPFPRLLT